MCAAAAARAVVDIASRARRDRALAFRNAVFAAVLASEANVADDIAYGKPSHCGSC
jgi:2-hydroxychromene-2-carboxylate isomerase